MHRNAVPLRAHQYRSGGGGGPSCGLRTLSTVFQRLSELPFTGAKMGGGDRCRAGGKSALYQILNDADGGAGSTQGGDGHGDGLTALETEQGLQRKIISRIEAGNEAISYSETKLSNSSVDAAVADKSVRDSQIASTIKEYLSGVTDANGVNLLYMGPYPRRYTHV